MPDWFYRTVTQPILFRLPAPRARDFALGFIGRLARLPLGPFLIDFLGHMRADPRLRRSLLDTDFPTAVGLGPWLDTRLVATEALSRFGVGFIEVGPVSLDGGGSGDSVKRIPDRQALWMGPDADGISLADCKQRLSKVDGLKVPVIVRLDHGSAEAIQRLIRELPASARLVSITTPAVEHLDLILNAAPSRHILLCINADQDLDTIAPTIEAALRQGVAGLIIDGSVKAEPNGRLIGLPVRERALQQVRELRRLVGVRVPIISSGGVHEPAHALELLSSGADLVQVDTGLIYTGPGLPKRINDCLLFDAARQPSPVAQPRIAELTWFWTTLMGAGMMIGGVLALVIAATKVVLPYDEAYLGTSVTQLTAINSRLLAFMAHDRVTLAGSMVAIGLLYVVLSVFGIRRGLHWARQAVLVSAFTGFASFFLFLGFGYLDTFHAFVTAALLQLLLFGMHARLGVYTPSTRPDLRGDRAWRLSLWGQLLLVFHGFALLAAGAAIAFIGVTQVFVHEDLMFMETTAATLAAANPRLVPLVAHDRATLGGMLLAGGWVFLLPALWGYRRGSSWLWWALLIAGSIAYAAGIVVHYAVGYLSFKHLLPAFGGYSLLVVGLLLSYPFLCRDSPDNRE